MSRDERLAQLLEELTRALRAGASPDLEAAVRRHPDLEKELRELWGSVLLAEEFARSAAPRAEPAEVAPVTPLPREFGDYELLEELGRGGMGVVYKARQKSLGRLVALKMVLRGDYASEVELARFRGEAEAAGRLDHPHLVPVYQAGVHAGQTYFTMRYVDGVTLARRLDGGPLPGREAAELLTPVCHAVHFAHGRGVLHRDLKPSNILLDREGRPYVTDFGLAKRVAGGPSLTGTGHLVGTPSYMPPEQAAGRRGAPGPRGDVYGLGAVLYETLTGRPPFQAATALDTVLLVLEQDLVPPRALNPRVDRDLEMICLKCLQKPPELRYPDAESLARDLEAYLRGDPVSARPSGLGYLVNRAFRDTHHAAVLENWGLLWMFHSVKILFLCVLTNALALRGVANPYVYLALWGGGLVAWGWAFWRLRQRGGPVTFVERVLAHGWGGGILASIFAFGVEILLDLPVLTLSPVLAIFAGMVFVLKGGLLSGSFYVPAALMFLTSLVMAARPAYGLTLFGVVSAASFLVPGYLYHRQRRRNGP